MAIIKNKENNKCQIRCGDIGGPGHCQWEFKMMHLLWKIVWQFFKKLKIELPYDLAIPLPKQLKAKLQTDISILIFIATLFTITKGRK